MWEMALRPTGVPRSGCKRCGFPGHLTFECRNVINTSIQSQRAAEAGPANPLQKVVLDVSSTSSEWSSEEGETPLKRLNKEELERKRRENKSKKKSKKKKRRKEEEEESSDSESDSDSEEERRRKRKKAKKEKKKKAKKEKKRKKKSKRKRSSSNSSESVSDRDGMYV